MEQAPVKYEWSPQQLEALEEIRDWLVNPYGEQVYRLFGFAGTGKTTLARFIGDELSMPPLYGAYTGKAASVLQQKGCPQATTIHRMIYKVEKPDRSRLLRLMEKLQDARNKEEAEKLKIEIEKEKEKISQPSFRLNYEDSPLFGASIAIIDEVSMVNDKIGRDLLSFEKRVLVLGDPAQLPPVKGTGYFDREDPDSLLTEIHRQAEGNPIIKLATEARKGNRLKEGIYGDSRVMRGEPSEEDSIEADQIIVGTNRLRVQVNHAMRHHLGFTPNHPVPGDKIVCLRNNHDIGIYNGQIWYVKDVLEVGKNYISLRIDNEWADEPLEVVSHLHYFQGRKGNLDYFAKGEQFDYGYALTCHKAQGSQWNNVMIFDESYCFRDDRDRWMYTAVTRAAEKVTVVRM